MKLAKYFREVVSEDWVTAALHTKAREVLETGPYWEKPAKAIHPSGTSDECARNVQLSLLGHKTGVQPQNEDRMDNGTAAHTRIQGRYERAGMLLPDSEKRLAVADWFGIGWPWSGRPDLVVRRPGLGTVHLGEIKTMNSYRAKGMPPQTDLDDTADALYNFVPGYVIQTTQYWMTLREYAVPELDDEVFFHFENTNDQSAIMRYWRPSRQIQELVKETITEAVTASRENRLVEPPYARRSPKCMSCYRRQVCVDLQDNDWESVEQVKTQLEIINDR